MSLSADIGLENILPNLAFFNPFNKLFYRAKDLILISSILTIFIFYTVVDLIPFLFCLLLNKLIRSLLFDTGSISIKFSKQHLSLLVKLLLSLSIGKLALGLAVDTQIRGCLSPIANHSYLWITYLQIKQL